MSQSQYRLLLGSSVASLVLSLLLLGFGFWRSSLNSSMATQQTELGEIQREVNRGIVSERLALELTQELSPMAATKPEVKTLLANYGVAARTAP